MSEPLPDNTETHENDSKSTAGNPFQASQSLGVPSIEPQIDEAIPLTELPTGPARYEKAPKNLMLLIFGSVLIWGIVHTIGSWLGGESKIGLKQNFVRGLVVLVCVGGFLLLWRVLLSSRKERPAKYRIPKIDPQQKEKAE